MEQDDKNAAERPEFSCEIRQDPNVLVVTLRGHLDIYAAKGLKEEIDELLDDGAERVVLDCQQLSYVGVSGLGIVLATAQELQRREGRFALCNLVPNLRDVFRLSDLDEIVPVFDSLDAAVAMATHGLTCGMSRQSWRGRR